MDMSRSYLRLAAVAGLTVALGWTGSPAQAGEWLLIEERWQETVRCGDVVGEASGTVVQRVRLDQREDGTVRFVLSERVKDSTFAGSDGRTYRVVGAGSMSGQAEPELIVDRQVVNLQFVGAGGLLGGLHKRWDGSVRAVSGGCDFVDDLAAEDDSEGAS